jgi:hypothetical protein
MAAATATIERFVGPADAQTLQRVAVRATPADVYDSIRTANLLSSPLTRALSSAAVFPERVLAWLRHDPRPPAGVRSATLDDMVAGDSPWLVLAEVPGVVIVLGLLWKPPAGTERCVPGSFASFAKPGFAASGENDGAGPERFARAVRNDAGRLACMSASIDQRGSMRGGARSTGCGQAPRRAS